MKKSDVDQNEVRPIRRFDNYEEFLKTFWPESAMNTLIEGERENGDFGTNLAIDSLERHANILKFGEP